MNESLVQWTLLNNLSFLGKILNFKIASKVGQEVTTDFGRIDFILQDLQGNKIIVELETILDDKSKLNYCFDQILNYKNVHFPDKTDYCILYASETNDKSKVSLENFAKKNNILTRSYSLNEIKILYPETIKRLSLSFGLALPQPKNYTICYLRWLNKILILYYKFKKEVLTFNEIFTPFRSSNRSKTNFNCYLRLALDFEMLTLQNDTYVITQNGKDYINNLNPFAYLSDNISSVDLTNEQKRLLLKILTNGNWTVHKVNIYWFLRFIEVTNGQWLPNKKYFDENKLELANSLFGVNYKNRTMYEFLSFACNWCMELGLVDRIKSTGNYDKLYLTPLGVEINNIFSLDLQLKKSRLNLSFKYLE